jgi:hypothetical protein
VLVSKLLDGGSQTGCLGRLALYESGEDRRSTVLSYVAELLALVRTGDIHHLERARGRTLLRAGLDVRREGRHREQSSGGDGKTQLHLRITSFPVSAVAGMEE